MVDERGNKIARRPAHQARKVRSLLGQELNAAIPEEATDVTPAINTAPKTPSEVGMGRIYNENSDGSPSGVRISDVRGPRGESRLQCNQLLVSGYEEAVGECEISSRGAMVPRIYHSAWECWATCADAQERVAGTAEKTESSELEGRDLNRITPKCYLEIEEARDASIRGIVGLAKVGSSVDQAMSLVNGYGAMFQQLSRSHSMVVMRKQTPLLYNAMIVSRADVVSAAEAAFSEAPTTSRIRPMIVVCVAHPFGLIVGSLDFAHEFLQAGTLAFGDRKIVRVPGYVVLPHPATLQIERREV